VRDPDRAAPALDKLKKAALKTPFGKRKYGRVIAIASAEIPLMHAEIERKARER
jgi:hypothetical protein